MKLGVLSDAHGNALGLRACLEWLRGAGAERIYFLGDAVGYLPGEGAVLQLLREYGAICQRGNHEAMLLGDLPLLPQRDRIYRLGEVRLRLSAGDEQLLREWPTSRVVTEDGRRLLFVHGSERDHLEGYVYPDTDLAQFDDPSFDVVFMGHTHRPFISRCAEKLFINVGSCGLPRDEGSLSSFATFDTVSGACEVFRLHMPTDAVLAQFGGDAITAEARSVLTRVSQTPVFGTPLGRIVE